MMTGMRVHDFVQHAALSIVDDRAWDHGPCAPVFGCGQIYHQPGVERTECDSEDARSCDQRLLEPGTAPGLF